MVFQVILILVVVVVGAYVLGIGTDFFDDLFTSFDQKLKKQAEVPEPTTLAPKEGTERGSVFARANLAEDTGSRICDLEITFVGTITDIPVGTPGVEAGIEGIIGLSRFLYHGDTFFGDIPNDTRIFDYRWYCIGAVDDSGEAVGIDTNTEICGLSGVVSTFFSQEEEEIICFIPTAFDIFSWNIAKNTLDGVEQLSLLSIIPESFSDIGAFGFTKSDNEIVAVNFIGKSKTNGKLLYTPEESNKGDEDTPFTKSRSIGSGAQFPIDYRLTVYLVDVTEDNYTIEHWYDEFRTNNENVGNIFKKNLCKPNLKVC